MFSIPQSTSFTYVFKAFLSSDHVTEATGKTIAITISKAGAAFGNPNAGATNATEISSGWYKVTLDTTDTGTLGVIAIRGAVATIDDVGDRLFVVKATNGGLTALPDTAVTTNASLPTVGTGTSQISLASGQVLLQTGTGAGQLDFTSGVVKANLAQILGTALTETAGQIAAAFKKFFNIAAPASTMDALTLVATATNLTNAPSAGDFTAAMKTSLNAATPAVTVSDKTGFSLTSGERTAIANEVEAQIIDETDSEKVLTAITDKIASVNPSLGSLTLSAIASSVWSAGTRVLTANTNFNDPTAAAVASAVRTELSTELGRVDAAVTSRMATYTQPTGFLAAAFPSDPADESLIIAATDSLASAIAALPTTSTVNAIKAQTDNLPADPAGVADIPTANQNADALLDRSDAVEVGLTPRQAIRLSVAADAGKLSGAATTTNTIRNAIADTKNRIVATVDSDGNRTAIIYDLT